NTAMPKPETGANPRLTPVASPGPGIRVTPLRSAIPEDLFGDQPESYWLDVPKGEIMRTIKRCDQNLPAVTTSIGPWSGERLSDDLRSAADILWLRRATSPPMPSTGEELRVADLFSGCGAMSLGVAEACRATGHRF